MNYDIQLHPWAENILLIVIIMPFTNVTTKAAYIRHVAYSCIVPTTLTNPENIGKYMYNSIIQWRHMFIVLVYQLIWSNYNEDWRCTCPKFFPGDFWQNVSAP